MFVWITLLGDTDKRRNVVNDDDLMTMIHRNTKSCRTCVHDEYERLSYQVSKHVGSLLHYSIKGILYHILRKWMLSSKISGIQRSSEWIFDTMNALIFATIELFTIILAKYEVRRFRYESQKITIKIEEIKCNLFVRQEINHFEYYLVSCGSLKQFPLQMWN